jgi:hypothetical protein
MITNSTETSEETKEIMRDRAFDRWFAALSARYMEEFTDTDVSGAMFLTWNHVAMAFITERSFGMAKASDWGEEVGRYNSTRDKTKIYTVRKYIGDQFQATQQRIGEYGCDCPGWRFSKDNPRTCIHVKTTDREPQRQRAERIVLLSEMLNRSGLLSNVTVSQYRNSITMAAKPKSSGTELLQVLNSAVGTLLKELESSGLLAPVDTSNDARPGKTRLITLD